MFERCRAGWACSRALPLCALVASCGSPAEPVYPGASSGPVDETATREKATRKAPRRWALLDTVRQWPSVTESPFPSRGHGAPRYAVDVRVSPEARAAYATWVAGATMPLGTLIVEFLTEPGNAKPDLVYGMRKVDEGAWEFFTASSRTGLLNDDPTLPACARCHAEAVSDFVFGTPRASTLAPE